MARARVMALDDPSATVPDAADEARHAPSALPAWHELYSFEFCTASRTGGYLTLALMPHQGRSCCCWLAVVDDAGRVAMAADNDLPLLPERQALAVDGHGLCCAVDCLEPVRRWAVRAEAGGLSLDLVFEAVGVMDRVPGRYVLPSAVRGSLRAGGQRFDVDGHGWRGHMWGEFDWARLGTRVLGRFDDGGWLMATGPAGAPAGVTVSTVAETMMPMPGPDGSTIEVPRDLCRVTTVDGDLGWGWLAGPRGAVRTG